MVCGCVLCMDNVCGMRPTARQLNVNLVFLCIALEFRACPMTSMVGIASIRQSQFKPEHMEIFLQVVD